MHGQGWSQSFHLLKRTGTQGKHNIANKDPEKKQMKSPELQMSLKLEINI